MALKVIIHSDRGGEGTVESISRASKTDRRILLTFKVAKRLPALIHIAF